MTAPYNCRFRRLGDTGYVICDKCRQVRKTQQPPESIAALCPVLLSAAPPRDRRRLNTVDHVLRLLKISPDTKRGLAFEHYRGYSVGLHGLPQETKLSGDHMVCAEQGCVIATSGKWKLVLVHDPRRKRLYATLEADDRVGYYLRWMASQIDLALIEGALLSDRRLVLTLVEQQGIDWEVDGSLVIFPTIVPIASLPTRLV